MQTTRQTAVVDFTQAEAMRTLGKSRPFWASLLVSAWVHAIVLIVLATASVRLTSPPTPPIPVTLIDPAPPPPPPGGATAAPAAIQVAKVEPLARGNEVVHRSKHLHIKRRLRRMRQETAVAAEPVASQATTLVAKPEGSPAGVAGGVAEGVAGGRVGGTAGGHGDELLRAEQAATPPAVISRLLPHYPPLARARGIEGLVILEAIVDRRGHVEQDGLKVLRSVPALDAAAVSAFRQWRFRPARNRDGAPVRVVLQVPIRFQLR